MEKTIRERVLFIRKVRDEHGLSAEKISDIVSRHGEYVSITTIRRVIAKDAENKRFRVTTSFGSRSMNSPIRSRNRARLLKSYCTVYKSITARKSKL